MRFSVGDLIYKAVPLELHVYIIVRYNYNVQVTSMTKNSIQRSIVEIQKELGMASSACKDDESVQ